VILDLYVSRQQSSQFFPDNLPKTFFTPLASNTRERKTIVLVTRPIELVERKVLLLLRLYEWWLIVVFAWAIPSG